jgi:hypothetical protein
MKLARAVVCSSLIFSSLFGCKKEAVKPPDRVEIKATPRRESLPAILVLLPASPAAEATLIGLRDELGEEYDFVPRVVEAETGTAQLEAWLGETRPVAVVLMNNPTLRLYRSYQENAPPDVARLPVIAVLSSFLRETSSGIKNLTGVIYEVPLVTSLVNLRQLLKQPLKRIGVVHRAAFRGFVEEQRALAAAEGFQVVNVEIQPNAEDLKNAVTRLRQEDKVDALWVLNDNALLDREKLTRGWLPALKKNKTPVVVNVSSLLSKRVEFGTFAVLPDHRALGVQAANLISSLAEREFNTEGVELEYPLSVEKVLDLEFARKNLDLEERQIATIDRLVE